ncbi:hypothetical protein D3C87_2197640 [compost metagenome]
MESPPTVDTTGLRAHLAQLAASYPSVGADPVEELLRGLDLPTLLPTQERVLIERR